MFLLFPDYKSKLEERQVLALSMRQTWNTTVSMRQTWSTTEIWKGGSQPLAQTQTCIVMQTPQKTHQANVPAV